MTISKIKDSYMIEGTYNNLIINGKLYEKLQHKCTIPQPISIQRKINNKVLDYYKVKGESDVLTPLEYQNCISELTINLFEGEWISIEERHAYESFINKCTAIFKYVDKLEDIKFTIKEYPESNNPLILPLRMLGNANPLFTYSTNFMILVTSIAKNFNYIQGTGLGMYDFSYSKSGRVPTIQSFSKIDGAYIKSTEILGNKIFAGTYEECENAYKNDITNIELLFKKALSFRKGIKVNNLTNVINKLDKLGKNISKLKVKVISEDDFRFLIKDINKFKIELETEL